jgi:hypothetical protein
MDAVRSRGDAVRLRKNSQMRAVPWKSGASAPRKAQNQRGLQPPSSHFVPTARCSAASAVPLRGMEIQASASEFRSVAL